jgi:DNA-binding response OmpR family regulator
MKIKGVRLLVVEDDPTLGAIWADILGGEGADVAGPCPSVARALAEIEDHPPAVAMLDIHLLDGTSFPVARALIERRVPFFFVSSCDPADLPAEFRPRPYLRKPVAVRDVMTTLHDLTHVG